MPKAWPGFCARTPTACSEPRSPNEAVSRGKLRDMPAVFAAVTGYASAEDQQRALAAGYDSFFVKPLDPTALVNLLRTYANSIA